ncbi:basic proline-rich protein [Bubalus bubalis]|uniref:basic proline-rich protein n=1 Tax=Bubalus bubalis TaxID=89462 RepID=UPI001E1B88BB|nr:basic proline-rich protein [Bubalus bubalis]
MTEVWNGTCRLEPHPPRLQGINPRGWREGAAGADRGSGELGPESAGAGWAEARGRRRRPALSHRRTDLGSYLLGQLPPPAQPPPQAWPAPPPPEGPGRGAPPPRPPAPRECPGCCPAEQRGARPPATAASLQAPTESPEKAGSLTEATLWKQEEGARPRASSLDCQRRRGLAGSGQCRPSPGARQPSPAPHTRTPARGGAVLRPSAPPCGRGRHRRRREEAAARPRKPKCPGRSRSLRGPLPPLSRSQAEPGAHGAPTSARRSPPLSPPRGGSAPLYRRSPRDPAARGAPGSGQVPCDVAARWGRLRARVEGGAGPGGAEPGRGAVPQLDGRGRPERRRRRTVSDRPTPGARAPDGADSADPLVQPYLLFHTWGPLTSNRDPPLPPKPGLLAAVPPLVPSGAQWISSGSR